MTSRSEGRFPRSRGRTARLGRQFLRERRRDEERPEAKPPLPRRSGPPPDIKPTKLGPVMDEAVARAKRRMSVGADTNYDLLYENFDVLHYLLQAPGLIDDPEVDLIEHFLEHGRAQGLSPHPDFSMVEYCNRYPKKTARDKVRNPFLYWLKYGRSAGDLADPAPGIFGMAPVLGLPPDQLADMLAERRRDLQQRLRTGRLGEVLARAAEIEPLIGETWTEIADPHLIPLSKGVVADETRAIYHAHEAAGFRRARIIFVIDVPRTDGGRRMEGHLAHALAAQVDPSEMVVIYTDDTGQTPVGRFPAGVREIDLTSITRSMPSKWAQHTLVMLLRTFQADAVVNINSKLLYHALRFYGHALAATERLFLCLFCNEQTAMGTWAGWSAGYFYRTFDHLTGVIIDNEYLAQGLTDTYRVSDDARERLHVFREPVDVALPVFSESPARPARRPQVFWAGRPRQLGLVYQVARLMPDVDFRMWAEWIPAGDDGLARPDNIRREGAYAHILEVPLVEADAWLYTSESDGAPVQLLEVAMTGIPIVGSLVGGTGEVLGVDDAWPVADHKKADAYVQSIREVLADPSDSRRRALALRQRMLRERSEKAFATRAVDVLLSGENSWAGRR